MTYYSQRRDNLVVFLVNYPELFKENCEDQSLRLQMIQPARAKERGSASY